MAPWPSSYVSSTVHKSIRNKGTSTIAKYIRNTAASDTGRLQTVDGNSAPYPLYNSTRGDTIATANPNTASVTRNAIHRSNRTTSHAVAGTAASGYFAVTQLTQTGSSSGKGRLPWPVGDSAPFPSRNTSSGVIMGSVASDRTVASGLLQATGAVAAPAFNFGTGTSPSAPTAEPSNSISDGNAITNTPMTLTSISTSANAMPSSTLIDSDEDGGDGDATVSPMPDSTDSSNMAMSSGNSLQNPTIWMNNVSCGDFTFTVNGSQQWSLLNGDLVVSTFESMFASNALICPDCWGGDSHTCTSSDWRCQYGLRDLSHSNTSLSPRWDTAAAHFAGQGSETDLTCGVMQTECSGAPDCKSCNGPGPWAIIKSLETMQNLMENIYNAIIQAGVACDAQMTHFSNVFAPVPSIQDQSLLSTLYSEVFGGIMGVIPGIGAIGGVAAGVASAVGLSNTFSHAPGPVDTATVLGTMANATALTYSNFVADLFANGSSSLTSADGKINTTITLEHQMKNGNLMQQQQDPTGFYTALIPVYQRILFQQLALYTWQNLEPQDKAVLEVNGGQHIPFITFDNSPCDQVDPKTPGTLLNKWESLVKEDANTTYDGRCYYLLDALVTTQTYDNGQTSGQTGNQICNMMSFPGGTNEALTTNAEQFASLSLADFIVPAVLGWQANGNLNGYPTAASNGVLPTDPQAAASVSILICDYANNENNPGAGCPKLTEKVQGTVCDTYIGANQPGSYNPGNCRAHVTQYKPNSGQNPLNDWELTITIFDNSNIEIGQATQQSAQEPLIVADSVLPFDLIVATGADKDTITFWYADQYWDSETGCKLGEGKMGGWAGGARQGDCGFQCPFPAYGDPPPVSATIAHPLPGPATAAIAGSATYLNTFITATPTATPAPPAADYARGKCTMHIKQYQKHEDGENETGDYQIDVVIYDAKNKALKDNGKVPAPGGQPVEVYGLVDTVTLTAGNIDNDPFTVNYQGDTWKTSDKGKCKVSKPVKGSRFLDCPLIC